MGRQRENPQPDSDSVQRVIRRLARVTLRPALVALAVAGISAVTPAQQPGADGPSKALEGRWRVELYLDKPSAHAEPMAGQINGDIAFSNTAWWNPSDRFGRHDINLQSFFGNSFLKPANVTSFGPGDTSMVTEVSGYVRGDSVGIDFIPRVDHGGLSMWGRFWGDSAKGRWYRRGNDGEGHFVLRRVSREPVAVAAIPDGRAAVVAAAPPPKPLTKAQARALARKEALAKAKAHADSVAVARAQAREKAKAEALAKAAARDSAKAIAVAQARAAAAARDSARAQALADARAKREAAKTTVAANTPAATAAPAPATRVAAVGSRALPNALTAAPAASYATTTRDGAASPPVRVASTSGASPANSPASAAPGTPAASTPAATAATAPASAPNAAPTAAPNASTSAAPNASPGAASPASSGAPGSGALRVRIFDEASKKYFVTTYSLHLPDGHWMYGQLRTGNGPDGFGPAVNRPPGKYEIEITNFMCGDKLWFFKDRILKPVVIEPGTPADVTISVNLPAAPARPSLENKTGASCSAAPASQG